MTATPRSPLATPRRLPLRPAETVQGFGATLVVAPHPDDETLGCGGAIALLREAGLPVHLLIVSDGAASHPRSRRFPPARLALLRESEACAALRLLGVARMDITFLRLPDTAVPVEGEAGFDAAVAAVLALLRALRPATVIAPWRREPHSDHRAASAIVRAALANDGAPARLLEYPIWAGVFGAEDDLPSAGECSAWRLAIDGVLARKRVAIAAYASQTSALIDDDPSGFRLDADAIARFTRPWELLLEEGA